MFSEMMVSDHVLNLQVLNSNSAKLSYNFHTKIMQEITPLVSDSFIEFSQPKTCFSSVRRTFYFSANPPMQNLQFAFTLDKMVGISYKLSIGESGKALQSNINANLLTGRMLHGNIRQFTSEGSKPFISLGLLDGHSLDFAFRNTMQDDWKIANLTNLDVFTADKLEPRLRISDAHNPALESGKSFLFAGFVFHSAKEVLKGFVNSIRNILLGLRINFFVFSSKIFAKVKLVKSYIAKFIGIFVKRKKLVVDYLASFKRINDSNLLLTRRVNTIPIHQQGHIKRIKC